MCNVVADRMQAKNLAAEQPERVARMRNAIDAWFATLPQTIDPTLQSKGQPRIAEKKAATDVDRRVVFARWDKNRDSLLTLEEYRGGLAKKENAERRFQNFDKNGDGRLSLEEFASPSR